MLALTNFWRKTLHNYHNDETFAAVIKDLTLTETAKSTQLRSPSNLPHEIRELIIGYGHENVTATHRSTLEFTKHEHLSKTGDCIYVVAADKALSDLSGEFKDALRNPNAKLTVRIEVDDLIEEIHAKGDSKIKSKGF